MTVPESEVLFPDVLETPDGRALVLDRGEVVGELVYDVSPIGRFEGDVVEPRLLSVGDVRRLFGL